MKEVLGLRPYYWLILIGGLVYGAVYGGVLDVHGIGAWFADRPEVAKAFSDPNFGRADALILVFSTLFLGPLALLLVLLVLIFVLAVFGGFLLPIVRWLHLPDWFATVLQHVVGGVADIRLGVDDQPRCPPRGENVVTVQVRAQQHLAAALAAPGGPLRARLPDRDQRLAICSRSRSKPGRIALKNALRTRPTSVGHVPALGFSSGPEIGTTVATSLRG